MPRCPPPIVPILGFRNWAPEAFADAVPRPEAFPRTILRFRSDRAAANASASTSLTDDEWIAHFGKFEPLPGNIDPPSWRSGTTATSSGFTATSSATGGACTFAQLPRGGNRVALLDLGTKGIWPHAVVAHRGQGG